MTTRSAHPTISREAVNVGVIEVRVHRVEELFNTFDPTPFPEKDLDDDAEEFIVSWARELPRNVPLLIRVQMSGPSERDNQAERTRDAIRTYFGHRAEITRLKFNELMSRGRASLLVGLMFLVACMVSANLIGQFGQGAINDIIREGLIIAGWVAMWRPLDIMLYEWWPMLGERRLFERLSDADVDIVSTLVPDGART